MIFAITPRSQAQNNQMKNVKMGNSRVAQNPIIFGSSILSVPIVHTLSRDTSHVLTKVGEAMSKMGKNILDMRIDGSDFPFIALTKRNAESKFSGDFELVRRIGNNGDIVTTYKIDNAQRAIEVSGLTGLDTDVNQEVTKYVFLLSAKNGIDFVDILAGLPR